MKGLAQGYNAIAVAFGSVVAGVSGFLVAFWLLGGSGGVADVDNMRVIVATFMVSGFVAGLGAVNLMALGEKR